MTQRENKDGRTHVSVMPERGRERNGGRMELSYNGAIILLENRGQQNSQ